VDIAINGIPLIPNVTKNEYFLWMIFDIDAKEYAYAQAPI